MRLILQHYKVFFAACCIAACCFLITACDDDESPKTAPKVKTNPVTEIKTTFATASGTIESDGGATIKTAGFVYSPTNATPTTADSKVEVTDTDGDFTTMLDNLTSGTKYYVRAFATNDQGTSYGDPVDFSTGNAAPTATEVVVTGTAEANKKLTGSYKFNDAEKNPEGTSIFKWYTATDALGAGEAVIAGATSKEYTVQDADKGKFIRFGVTPVASAGTTTGVEVKSPFTNAVGEATTVTFMYNNKEVTYGIFTSQATGRKWLDRNLGAPNTPSSVDDYLNYGDLFQWGRPADGHQVVTRTSTANDAVSGVATTDILSSDDTPDNDKFILSPTEPSDWRNPQNLNLWQGVNGINNPCPSGWRIPTLAEFDAEGLGLLNDDYAKLNITRTGYRTAAEGDFDLVETQALLWTSTIDPNIDPQRAIRVRMTNLSGYTMSQVNNATGIAVRCIKD